MDSIRIMGLILDIGSAMIQSGAETHRVEDSLYRLCASYGFTQCNVWVVPTNIQATVTTPGGECITQIRHIRHAGVDFDHLDQLNALSRYACAKMLDAKELGGRLQAIQDSAAAKPWVNYLAGALASAGFGVFFNCDVEDMLSAVCVSLLISFFGRRLSTRESNPMIQNFIIAFLAELFIILSVHLGFGHHMGYITVAVVMLLVSALGTTNGVRDLVHLDTLSGIMNISTSFAGAVGIAMGIVLPLSLFLYKGSNEITLLNPSVVLELLGCTVGCAGFAFRFHVKGRKVIFCATGALLTWAVYLLAYNVHPSTFTGTLMGAAACAVYAQTMARVNKVPATIFQTVSVFPLIPGAALYYMMYGFVIADIPFAIAKGTDLLLSCSGIVFGFMVVEVAGKYIGR